MSADITTHLPTWRPVNVHVMPCSSRVMRLAVTWTGCVRVAG
jgi:hypothetical protein